MNKSFSEDAQEQVTTLVDDVIDRIMEISDHYGVSAVSIAREFKQQYNNRSEEDFGV